MKYLCRNKDGSLVVFKEEPKYDIISGKYYVVYINRIRFFGEPTEDPEHLYDSLEPEKMVSDEHINYLCDECNKVSKIVEYKEDPYDAELYDEHIMKNFCPDCYETASMEI